MICALHSPKKIPIHFDKWVNEWLLCVPCHRDDLNAIAGSNWIESVNLPKKKMQKRNIKYINVVSREHQCQCQFFSFALLLKSISLALSLFYTRVYLCVARAHQVKRFQNAHALSFYNAAYTKVSAENIYNRTIEHNNHAWYIDTWYIVRCEEKWSRKKWQNCIDSNHSMRS